MSCECEMFLFRGFFYGISSPVQMMTKARTIQRGKGNSQDTWFIRVKERTNRPRIRRCWQGKMVLQSWQSFSSWFLCMSLFRAAVLDFSFLTERRATSGAPRSHSVRTDSQPIMTCFRKNHAGNSAHENREHCVLVWGGTRKKKTLQISSGSGGFFSFPPCDLPMPGINS